jgi:hypothetical protein
MTARSCWPRLRAHGYWRGAVGPGLTCADPQGAERLCPEWRALLLKYPGRFLIGSNTWVNQRWLFYDDLMKGYRTWLGDLPPDVARHIAWNNGAALFGLPLSEK